MNNEFDPSTHNESIETAFENWLRADEVPARPPAAFRQRLRDSIEAENANKGLRPSAVQPASRLARRIWLSGFVAAAAAAGFALAISLYNILQSGNDHAETLWIVAEMELYAAMFESIDVQTLNELADLLANY